MTNAEYNKIFFPYCAHRLEIVDLKKLGSDT